MKTTNLNLILRILLSLILALGVSSVVLGQKKAKLTPDVKEALITAQVLLVRYEAPPLNVMTPKDAAGEGLIANITQSDEAEDGMRHRYYPSVRIQKQVDSVFRAEGIMTNISLKEEAFDFTMPSGLKDLSKYEGVEADYVVELYVPLMGFQATYMPIKWRKYNLQLGCIIRIIRLEDQKLVWKSNAGHTHLQDGSMKFHIDELAENGKELISGKVDQASHAIALNLAEKYQKAKK